MERFMEVIRAHAERNMIEPSIVYGVIMQESSGNQHAYNPEPKYRYLWDVNKNRPFRRLTSKEIISETPPHDFPTLAGDRDQEWWAQQASWGLMQCMGAVLREYGYADPFIPAIVCDVGKQIEIGARHLGRQIKRHGLHGGISAYNAGSPTRANEHYVQRVLKFARLEK